MYKKGDNVLYGTYGVCVIEEISTLDIPGIDNKKMFYTLCPRNSTAKIYVPVDGDTSKLKNLLSKKEAMDLIEDIHDLEPLRVYDKKKPESSYKEAIRSGDRVEMIRLIKCIYFRNKERSDEGKKTTTIDEKYMHIAEDMIYQELGEVLKIPKDQIVDYLTERIEGKNH